MVTKLGRMVTYLIGSHPMKLLDPLVMLIARSCDKLLLDHVTLYLHSYIVYGHQTSQGGALPWGVPFSAFTWPFNYVALLDQ